MNSITITGNATRQPELRFTTSGAATCSFGVAVNRRWQNKQTHEWDEEVTFFDVVCWQQLAENVAESVDKGTAVVVTGRVQFRDWEDKKGEKRRSTEIVADEVGVSLRYATLVASRNERVEPGQKSKPVTARQAPEYSEEPF